MSYNVLVIEHGVYTRLMSYVKTMIKEVRFFLFTLGKSEISLGTFTSLALFDPLNDALHSPTFPPTKPFPMAPVRVKKICCSS